MLAEWSFENKEEEKDLKSRDKVKEDHSNSQQIKSNNFTASLWDTRKEILYPISITIEADLSAYKITSGEGALE